MESEFENYVSEFDLNLFEQATKNNRVDTASTQCPVSRKLGIARIKERLKGVSQVVHKAKNTNEILLKVQEELRFSKQELEETRNLLFEKNEEHKVICEERSMYFNQASGYCNEIQNLKEKVKSIEELEFSIQLKDKIINGYSEQMKGLQVELDNLKESKKDSDKYAASVMRKAKINKTAVEKQIKRLLTQYVLPNTKERCKWLQSIIRQYIPKECKEDDENEKIEKQDEVVEKDDEISSDIEVPLSQPVLQNYTSTDFDCVESIDTGRGSSLAYSDGDKSFHSPDYYMGDSPPCINPPCNKCNVTKSDASTSTISQEMLAVTDDFEHKVVMVSKKDSCTSPIPWLTRDITTDTADISFDDTPINYKDNTNLENHHSDTRKRTHSTNNNKIVFGNKESLSLPTVIQSDSKSEQKTVKTPINLQDFTFDSGDEDDEIISDDSRLARSVGVLNALNSADFDNVVIHSKYTVSIEEPPTEKEHENTSDSTNFTNIEETSLKNKDVSSSPAVIQSDSQSEQKSIDTPIRLQYFTFDSRDENAEIMNGDNRVVSPVGVLNALNSPVEEEHQNTSEITHWTNIEEISLESKDVSSCPTVSSPPYRAHKIIPEKETNKVESSIFESEDDGGELVNGGCRTVHPFSDTMSDFDVKVVPCNNENISSEEIPVVKIQSNKGLYAEDTREILCTVKLQIEAASDTDDDDELMHHANKIGNLVDESSMTTFPCFGKNKNLSPSLSSDELLTNTTEIYNVTTGLETNISTQQENENLVLKSSNNCSTEYEMNSEIKAILDEMRSYRLISPIPTTPPRSEILSPRPPENYEINYDQEAQTRVIAESINSQLNLLSTKVQGVFAPFIETIPGCIDQVLSLLDKPHKRTISSLLDSTINIKENKCNMLSASDKLEPNYKRQPETAGLNIYSKEHNLLPANNHLKSSYNGQPEKDVQNLYSMLSTTEDNQNQVHELVSIDEDLEIMAIVDSSSVYGESVCKSNELSRVMQKSGPSFKADKSKLLSGIVPSSDKSDECCNSNYDHGVCRSAHALFGTGSEFIEDTESRDLLSNAVAEPIALKFKDNILYEGDDMCNISDNNMQLDDSTQHIDENSVQVLEKSKIKVRKLTKLERMRLKLVPKCKIKRDVKKTIKNPVLKPTPVTLTLPKNKVTVSDTAATLNDKSVYENAVKILAAQRLLKEPRIVIENCDYLPQNKSIENEIHCKNNNSPEWSSNNSKSNKKRNSSENVTNSPENRSLDSYPLSNLKDKKTSICLNESHNEAPVEIKQKSYKNSPKSDENISSNVEKKVKKITRKKNPPCDKSDSESSKTKRTLEPALSPDVGSAKESKRKRSVSDRHQNSDFNSTVVESDSSRILRSYSQAKHTKEKESEEHHVVAKRREGLRSSADQRLLSIGIQETCPVLVKKQRISRINTNTQQDSERMQELSHHISSFSKSKPSQKNNSNSSVNLDFISNGNNTQDSPLVSRNKRHDRTSEVNRQTQRDDKSTQPQVVNHHSAVSKIWQKNNDQVISYEDLDILSNETDILKSKQTEYNRPEGSGRKDSLLCKTIDKYGMRKIKLKAKQTPESKVQEVCNELETRLSEIIELPHESTVSGMKRLAADIRTWNVKHFLLGFIKFLRNPERKNELFNKSACPPAPSMTKKEQILIYIFDELQRSPKYSHIVRKILNIIEYSLFALNKPAEEFNVIEVMSHFFAILCRAYNNISRLRIFIIDAMYCLQFKSVVLVQQCLDVWMFVLPLGHMGLAKCPLVTCLVYLLHFYKCEDKHNRVQDIRNTLRWKYNYDLQDWNEPKILDLFRTAITEIKDIPMDRKILRLALLILAKRNGATWCNNNVVINMLLPIINDSKTSALAKQFSIMMLGPLLKPYPANMKVHCETIIDYLMDMLQNKNSQNIEEAIISSLICLEKNNDRLYRYLANWNPKHVSLEFELIIKNYVTSKPVYIWKNVLSQAI